MNLLGIVIKKNGKSYYSKPFIINYDEESNIIAQLIRDSDYSLLIDKNENFILDIISYPDKLSYITANIEQNIEFKKFGSYQLKFDKITDQKNFFDMEKGSYFKNLDSTYNLEIKFTVLLRPKQNKKYTNNEYILTTPILKFNKEYTK